MTFVSALNFGAEHSHARRFAYRRRKKRNSFIDQLTLQEAVPRTDLLLGGAVAGGLAATALGVFVFTGGHPLAAVRQLITHTQSSGSAIVVYGVSAVILPNLFISQTALSVSAGVLFGPVRGALISIPAQATSGMLAYGIGRVLTRSTKLGNALVARIEPYIGRFRRNPFEGILITRLLFLPEEAVSYAAGMLGIDFRSFMIGTIAGITPKTIFFTQVGAAIAGGVLGSTQLFNVPLLIVSGTVVGGSMLIARRINSAEQAIEDDPDIIEGEIISETTQS